MNLREETRAAASVICRDVFGHLFFLDPDIFSAPRAEAAGRPGLGRGPLCSSRGIFLPLLFRGASAARDAMRCGAARRDENSRMRSAAGCSLHNAVVTYRACISLPGRGLTAKTAGHRPIFSRDSSINGNAVISRLRSNDCTGRFERTSVSVHRARAHTHTHPYTQ